MSARRIVIGCSVVAGVVLVVLIVGGVAAFRHYTAVLPIPPAARLAEADSLGLAVLHLRADDPWIRGTFTELSKYQMRESRPEDVFPVEAVWVARRSGAPASEGHMVSVSLSHSGRLLSLMGDFALWRAARGKPEHVARVEHHGESITSFPGTPIRGFVFLRGTSAFWSSDLETAEHAVDLAVASEQASQPPAGLTGGRRDGEILPLIPGDSTHVLAGAILNEGGSLARILSLVPGDALDLPEDPYAHVASLSFTFDATTGAEGTGEVILRMAPGTSPEEIHFVAEDFAARLQQLKLARVAFTAAPRAEAERAVLSVKASGLDSIGAPLLEELARSAKRIEKIQQEGGQEEGEAARPPADPNQSSSTFQ